MDERQTKIALNHIQQAVLINIGDLKAAADDLAKHLRTDIPQSW